MENIYGVDVDYFKKELIKLADSLENRTKEELWRYLNQLALIVEPDDENKSDLLR